MGENESINMQREPILMKKLMREKTHGKLVIGIIGTHRGAGVTHFGILLGNYLSGWLGQKTAILECSSRNDLQFLQQYFYDSSEDSYCRDSFSMHRITFYKNRNLQSIPEIMGERHDCVILDFGTDMVKNKSEFLRCDIKIVVSSLAVWKKHELERFINNHIYIKNCEQWIYVIPFMPNKVLKEAAKKLQRKIYGIPYEPDPFVLSDNAVHLFQKLI